MIGRSLRWGGDANTRVASPAPGARAHRVNGPTRTRPRTGRAVQQGFLARDLLPGRHTSIERLLRLLEPGAAGG